MSAGCDIDVGRWEGVGCGGAEGCTCTCCGIACGWLGWVKLGAELSEDVTEVTGTSGCGGGTGGTDWIGWGSGATGDSLGGFVTGSGAGNATGSLDTRHGVR